MFTRYLCGTIPRPVETLHEDHPPVPDSGSGPINTRPLKPGRSRREAK